MTDCAGTRENRMPAFRDQRQSAMSWSYQSSPPITDQEYVRWEHMLEQRTGIHFSSHRAILKSALLRRMREVGCQTFEDYYRRVCGFTPAAASEWISLVNGLTVRETRFFRHAPSFGCVRRFLLDRWQGDAARPLRIWSAGCASGEEAYSLALVAAECEAYTGQARGVEVVASDISETALAEARQAVYPDSRLVGMTDAQVANLMEAVDARHHRVKAAFTGKVTFLQANLLQSPVEPGSCDVVFCQNVLIYFRPARRDAVLAALVDALRPGGLLVTGPGETGRWQDKRLVRLADSQVQAWIRRADNDKDMTGVNHG